MVITNKLNNYNRNMVFVYYSYSITDCHGESVKQIRVDITDIRRSNLNQ